VTVLELPPALLSEIERRFAERDREAARTLLSGCQSEVVCMAILRLSRGRLDRVESLLEDARRDWRDVLAWAQQPVRTYVAGILREGPAWTDDDDRRATGLDYNLLRQWKKDGHVVVGGWFTDRSDSRGLYLFAVDSVAEAEALVRNDPSVQSGKLVFEFHPWLAPDGLRIARPDEL
jgi:hypothetical protein